MRAEGDVVLIYYEDQPTIYARFEEATPDMKKGWYHASLLLLTIPPQPVTWILREEYIDGGEFTMGGKSMRLETVQGVPPEEAPQDSGGSENIGRPESGGTVIPFKPKG
ncbi:MAG: hypothetical protein JRK53_04945 [Deltaproteobacteria bacterium]|nr:hypothetical protein [Deltaproteobacteria bacterium]MBW1815730.1 hypothetical protein [Deltaproteobacteria bacterium]MBW2285415.1 hypothetical protein [Deltaproteobacteria bacterium]